VKSIRLRPGKERSLQRKHPWVFEGSVASGKADPGETVRVESAEGVFLAWGAYSGSSQIRVRAWSFDEAERIDAAFFARRVQRAVALRARLPINSTGVRLVHAEADGLPGLIVDRYGGTLCAQFLSAGTERWKQVLADSLLAATGCSRLYERSDASVRGLEGLEVATGWLRNGEDSAEATSTEVTITEHNWRLTLDVATGHKTGFYLDQRDNRALLASWVKQLGSQRVLNTYCYTGGFSVAALAGGAAHVTSVDSSAPALARLQSNVASNGFDLARSECHDADVNSFLRQCVQSNRSFDAIVLDPPKFAPTAAHAERAARAYKDINRLALMLLAPGGLLLTFSCSGGVSADLFHKIVAGAAADAGENGTDGAIVQRLEGACDHPTTLVFPEGEYLKGLAIVKDA
jgi:23S rRNA (cytosine1962-C5)-methyltransferase